MATSWSGPPPGVPKALEIPPAAATRRLAKESVPHRASLLVGEPAPHFICESDPQTGSDSKDISAIARRYNGRYIEAIPPRTLQSVWALPPGSLGAVLPRTTRI